MRIISGSLKGKSIAFLKNKNTRPLKDSVKENIFNILEHSNLFSVKIKKSNILDLYSGIGSFGLECISRGAAKVTFVEKDRGASKILEENLKKLSIIQKAQIINSEIVSVLDKKIKDNFDIFFLDPPFADKQFFKVLSLIRKKKIYKFKHIIIIHRERRTIDDLGDIIEIIDIKKYGRSKIIFGFFK